LGEDTLWNFGVDIGEGTSWSFNVIFMLRKYIFLNFDVNMGEDIS
jgi:hypothetical protein